MSIIKVEMEKDIQLLKAIAKCGIMTEESLPLLDISIHRLKQHIDSGYIDKKGTFMLFGKMTNIYVLTSKAKRRMTSEFLINPYKSDVSQIEHDYVLLQIYMILNYKEKESWVTETKLHIDYPNCPKTVDAVFTSASGKRVGLEVVTDSYSELDVEYKKDFIRHYCDDYIMIHNYKDIEYKI